MCSVEYFLLYTDEWTILMMCTVEYFLPYTDDQTMLMLCNVEYCTLMYGMHCCCVLYNTEQ